MELNEVQKEADSAGRKAVFFGLGALLLAGLFGWMVAHLASTGPETQPVVVAATDIAPLSQIKVDQLKVVEWPTGSIPHGTFQKPDDVVHTGEININGILAGEAVLADRLSTPDRGLGMSQMVEPNMRAYVVRVDDHVATAEILHPGAFVDVAATLDDPKKREPVTKVILQNVQVLGIGDSIDVERAQPRGKDESVSASHEQMERHRVVTLLINTADMELLSFASRSGKLDLILRNNNDVAIAPSKGVTFDKVMGRSKEGDAKKEDAPAEAPAVHHAHPARRSGASAGPSIIRVNH